MTAPLLDRLEELLRAGTERPWRVALDRQQHEPGRVMGIYGPEQTTDYGLGPERTDKRIVETDGGYHEPDRPDADLIVAAVNALPALIRVARAAQEWRAPGTASTRTGKLLDALADLDKEQTE